MTPQQSGTRDVSLRQAFLYALGYFEIWDNAPPAERIGLLPGGQETPGQHGHAVTATGTELVAAIPRSNPAPSRRNQQPKAAIPFEPRVPSVPTHKELTAMEIDRASNPSGRTRAEQRALMVAEWFRDVLATETLTAEGRCLFIPKGGSKEFYLDGYSRVDAAVVRVCRINFAESWIHDPGSVFSLPNYPEAFLGKIWYEDVTVRYDALFDLLKGTRGPRFLPEFVFDPPPSAQDAARCVIKFEGEVVKLPLAGDKGRHRSLMALALLIRWSNQSISPQLLHFLTHRDVNTTKKSPEEFDQDVKFSKEIGEIAVNLFENKVSIVEAHNELARILSSSEGEDVYNWLPHAVPRLGVRKTNPSKSYLNRKGYTSGLMDKIWVEIAKRGGPKTSTFLQDKLDMETHAFTFRPNRHTTHDTN